VECFTPAKGDIAPINLTPLIRLDHNYKVHIGNDSVVFINVCHPLLPVEGLNCVGGSSACVAHLQNGSPTDEKVASEIERLYKYMKVESTLVTMGKI
jgi:hypothetical protein